MSKPSIRIHNTETDEVIDREMTDAEYAQYQQEQVAQVQRDDEASQKAVAKNTLLAKLGLTADEAALLLG